MGWLGWTESQALASDINAIEVAYRGRVQMLQAIFGGEDQPNPKRPPRDARGDPITLSPQVFDTLFGKKSPTILRSKKQRHETQDVE